MDVVINPFSLQTPDSENIEFCGDRLPWGSPCFVTGDNLDHARAFALGAFGLNHIIMSEYKLLQNSKVPKYEIPFISYTSSTPHAEISRFAPTVLDEMVLGLSAFIKKDELIPRCKDAADSMEILHLLDRHPLALSGGETARVILATHLARRPQIWFIDQILGELDISLRKRFLNYLFDYCREYSSIVLIIEDLSILLLGTKGHVWYVGKDSVLINPQLEEIILNKDLQISDELKIKPSLNKDDSGELALVVNELSVTRSGKQVMRNLSFSANYGQLLWIFGKNGVGKTTLLESLVGLSSYEKGEIRFYRNGRIDDIYSNISYSPQHPDIDITENTLIEEIAFAIQPSWKIKKDSLRKAESWLSDLHLGKDNIYYQLSNSLGFRKLASVLSSFARKRPVIALDEPTLFLGRKEVKLIANLISRYVKDGYLILVATHDQRLISEMNKLIMPVEL
jgi:energy-coupling factor transporter ATP-binding protein EcfA2